MIPRGADRSSDASLAALANTKTLEGIQFDFTTITDDGMKHAPHFHHTVAQGP